MSFESQATKASIEELEASMAGNAEPRIGDPPC